MIGTTASMGSIRATVRAHRLAAFGTAIVGLTCAAVASQLGRDTTPFALVFVPAVAALGVAALADGRPGVSRLVRRITRWRAAPRWYAVALGIPLAMWLAIVVAGVAVGTPLGALFRELPQILIVFLVVLVPGLLEEFGWRGYGVPASPASWSVLRAALTVGLLFIIPHLFLYLPGQLYDNLPIWPLPLLLLSGSVLYTWVYVGSGGSALLAGLMHAASNGLIPLSRGIDPVVVWQLQGITITLISAIVLVASARMRRPLATETSTEEAAVSPTALEAQPVGAAS
jgi:membrane protease YdiL (CAAX protease family)